MARILEEKMNEVKKVYENEMADAANRKSKAIQFLNEKKEYAYRHVQDEFHKRNEDIMSLFEIRKQEALNKKQLSEQVILRDIDRQKAANTHIKRDSSYPTHIPPREEPRETPNRTYKFNESDENNIQDYYYKVLGVTRNASRQEIKKAYHAKSKIYHPDRASDHLDKGQQEDMFKLIHRAFRLLSVPENEEWKKMYDERGNRSGWVQVQPMKSSYASSEYNLYRVIQ